MLICALENLQIRVIIKKLKRGLYKVLARLVVLYACESWPTSKEYEKKNGSSGKKISPVYFWTKEKLSDRRIWNKIE